MRVRAKIKIGISRKQGERQTKLAAFTPVESVKFKKKQRLACIIFGCIIDTQPKKSLFWSVEGSFFC
jgi:hypothetical protein